MGPKTSSVRITRFYRDIDSLCQIVGDFLGAGLKSGDPAVVIVTPQHAATIDRCLRRLGLDVELLKRFGDYVVLDARETLDAFMIDGSPEPETFRHNMSNILNQAVRGRENTIVCIFGEMIDLLWRDGREGAAIRVETLWNELASTYAINAIFAYSLGDSYKDPSVV